MDHFLSALRCTDYAQKHNGIRLDTVRQPTTAALYSWLVTAVALWPLVNVAGDDPIFSDRIEGQFFLDTNGVTVKCPLAEVGEQGMINGVMYTKRTDDQITTENASTTCTSGITNMRFLFFEAMSFNKPLESWDTSSVTDMDFMFSGARSFNQPIGSWDTSAVTSMSGMFGEGPFQAAGGAESFDQSLDSWDTGSVTDMSGMFWGALAFDQPLNS